MGFELRPRPFAATLRNLASAHRRGLRRLPLLVLRMRNTLGTVPHGESSAASNGPAFEDIPRFEKPASVSL